MLIQRVRDEQVGLSLLSLTAATFHAGSLLCGALPAEQSLGGQSLVLQSTGIACNPDFHDHLPGRLHASKQRSIQVITNVIRLRSDSADLSRAHNVVFYRYPISHLRKQL